MIRLLIFTLATSLAIAGCGIFGLDEQVEASGTVYLDGVPVANWSVRLDTNLESDIFATTQAEGLTGADGRYSLSASISLNECNVVEIWASGSGPEGVYSGEPMIVSRESCGTHEEVDFNFITPP